MWLAVIAVLIGLAILVWSADIFIDGATTLANSLGVPSFLIGVVILGLGTSVSAGNGGIGTGSIRRQP